MKEQRKDPFNEMDKRMKDIKEKDKNRASKKGLSRKQKIILIGVAGVAAVGGVIWSLANRNGEEEVDTASTAPALGTSKPSEAAGSPTPKPTVAITATPNIKIEGDALNPPFKEILPGQEYDIPGRAIIVGDVNPYDSDSATGQIQIIREGERITGIAINGGVILYGYKPENEGKIIDFQVSVMKKIGGDGPSNPPQKVLILDNKGNILRTEGGEK